jgi:hypothetical protein
MPPRNPTEHINDSRVAHVARERVGDDLEQKVRRGIFEVIDIGLYLYAIDSIDRLPVLFVKGELHIRFAN